MARSPTRLRPSRQSRKSKSSVSVGSPSSLGCGRRGSWGGTGAAAADAAAVSHSGSSADPCRSISSSIEPSWPAASSGGDWGSSSAGVEAGCAASSEATRTGGALVASVLGGGGGISTGSFAFSTASARKMVKVYSGNPRGNRLTRRLVPSFSRFTATTRSPASQPPHLSAAPPGTTFFSMFNPLMSSPSPFASRTTVSCSRRSVPLPATLTGWSSGSRPILAANATSLRLTTKSYFSAPRGITSPIGRPASSMPSIEMTSSPSSSNPSTSAWPPAAISATLFDAFTAKPRPLAPRRTARRRHLAGGDGPLVGDAAGQAFLSTHTDTPFARVVCATPRLLFERGGIGWFSAMALKAVKSQLESGRSAGRSCKHSHSR
mmetsp:Transcript_12702/g.28953  ORF Transcript_12702/g.28953 Transcript_12702/m.28953 type:complete len:377 (+) Transcript_12702:726-1856(+)